MSDGDRITFYVDEHLPLRFLKAIFDPYGHELVSVEVKTQDPAILRTAEVYGAVVVTADTWFLKELNRYPFGHPKAYSQAGVVQVHGTWSDAHRLLVHYAPLINTICALRTSRQDQRVGIDLSQKEIRVFDFTHRPDELAH